LKLFKILAVIYGLNFKARDLSDACVSFASIHSNSVLGEALQSAHQSLKKKRENRTGEVKWQQTQMPLQKKANQNKHLARWCWCRFFIIRSKSRSTIYKIFLQAY